MESSRNKINFRSQTVAVAAMCFHSAQRNKYWFTYSQQSEFNLRKCIVFACLCPTKFIELNSFVRLARRNEMKVGRMQQSIHKCAVWSFLAWTWARPPSPHLLSHSNIQYISVRPSAQSICSELYPKVVRTSRFLCVTQQHTHTHTRVHSTNTFTIHRPIKGACVHFPFVSLWFFFSSVFYCYCRSSSHHFSLVLFGRVRTWPPIKMWKREKKANKTKVNDENNRGKSNDTRSTKNTIRLYKRPPPSHHRRRNSILVGWMDGEWMDEMDLYWLCVSVCAVMCTHISRGRHTLMSKHCSWCVLLSSSWSCNERNVTHAIYHYYDC